MPPSQRCLPGIRRAAAPLAALLLSGCATLAPPAAPYDTVLRGGTIYDGSRGAGRVGDVGIRGDRIACVGSCRGRTGREIDATGLAVAPGFINMLSWSGEALMQDGRAQSVVRQGVTLEVMGEGSTGGPINAEMKARALAGQGSIRYPIDWTSFGGWLEALEKRGVSTNVASFVGATTIRIHELGQDDVDPDAAQLARMKALVRQAMDEGAMGVGTSLIYVPANFAETDELVALVSEAARCEGMYISHIRSEGGGLLEAIDELIEISRRSGARAEVYHLKAAGKPHWPKMDQAIARIAAARVEGLPITADMYLYTASGTGLDSTLPIWLREGGHAAMVARLKQPGVRERVLGELRSGDRDWSLVQPIGFQNPALRRYAAKRLTQIAAERGSTAEETAIDLVVEDGSRVGTLFHSMSEDNIRKGLVQPWVSFGSDAGATATEPPFTDNPTHPRGYGNFARLLGRYVREEKLLTLGEAVRKLTSLPAANLRIADRGRLKPGHFADIAVFDPRTIADLATFEDPHRYATGMRHVFVNGTAVLAGGEHTGATPGRFVKGAGAGRCKAT